MAEKVKINGTIYNPVKNDSLLKLDDCEILTVTILDKVESETSSLFCSQFFTLRMR